MDVYLDYAANTPINPIVLQTMFEFKKTYFGNPSSPHRYGQKVKYHIEMSRDTVARFLHCNSAEIYFTSGGTESNNLALMGAARMFPESKKHIIVAATEHPSVIKTGQYLAENGFDVTFIKPDNFGEISISQIKKECKTQTALISAMYVNNETGIINPVEEIADFCDKENILFHCDAVQAVGKIPLNLTFLKADLLSLSAHKIYGPEGVGALFIRKGTPLAGIQKGGKQETARRAGTENVMGIIGLGKALELLDAENNFVQTEKIQGYFESELKRALNNVDIIGRQTQRSPYISNVAFKGIDNTTMLLNLDLEGIAASSGSACSSGSITKSPVLQAMELPSEIINGAVRFSFGKQTTVDEIDYALQKITNIVKRFS